VPQDYAAAASWYRKAAEQGNADAQFNLGSMYYKSLGVPQDHVIAYMWLKLCGSQRGGIPPTATATDIRPTAMARGIMVRVTATATIMGRRFLTAMDTGQDTGAVLMAALARPWSVAT
jgi:hypothetical protein